MASARPTPTQPVSGAFDLADEQATHAESLAEASRAYFRQQGYGPVSPPILERAAPFLDRLGEEIRRHMYIFTDPGGHEVCLRPEMTIPTARLYADAIQGRGGVFRCYYVGPVFRFDWPKEGRYRQFTQAGAEFFGEHDQEVADAEVLALADGLLRSLGVGGLEVVLGDVSFFTALLADDRLAPPWQLRLGRVASDFGALEHELERNAAMVAAGTIGAHGHPDDELGALLDHTPPAQRDALLGGVLGALGTEHFGVRSPEEVASRLLNRSSAEAAGPLAPEIAAALSALLAVDASLDVGLRQVRQIAVDAGSDALVAVVDAWDRRVALLSERGVDTDAIRLRPRMGRGIDYYTGFVFEIHDGTGSAVSQLCGGGRYDDLVASVGGSDPVPAVGFSLGLERVQLRVAGAASP